MVFDLPLRFRSVQPPPSPASKTPTPVAPAEPGNPGSLVALYKRAAPAVVTVLTETSLGSGFFLDARHLVTNRHVVGDSNDVVVELNDGRRLGGTVVRRSDEDLDFAIVWVDEPYSEAPLPVASDLPEPGTPIVVVGSPKGLKGTLTAGIVSSIRFDGPVSLVQVDAAINPGNSGGPVLNRRGEVVGIATFTYRGTEGLAFAISARHLSVSEGGVALVATR